MAKFLTSNELNSELEKLIENANKQLILISPYIKLHDRYKSALRTKQSNHKLEIVIVFGKNVDDITKSLNESDFKFLREFTNIQIRHEKNLHAKYYSSESSAILTSMNLYNYSQNNNIEAGILTKAASVANKNSVDQQASLYFSKVITQSKLLFERVPEYETALLGLKKKYKTSTIKTDKLSGLYLDKKIENAEQPFIVENKIEYNTPSPGNKVSETTISSFPEYTTVSSISNKTGIPNKILWTKLESMGLLERKNDEWILTAAGIEIGAEVKETRDYKYIAWPISIIDELK
jgi:hypothetical protein